MWMLLSRASGLDGVPQLRRSSARWRWCRDPADAPAPNYDPRPDDRVIRTGFAALDAILGPGGLPKSASVAIRGDGLERSHDTRASGSRRRPRRPARSSPGSTCRAASTRSRRSPAASTSNGSWSSPRPASTRDCRIAGSLLAGRSVDLLVLDLPGGRLAKTDKPSKVADRLHRLAALARRAETLLLILDAPGLGRRARDRGRPVDRHPARAGPPVVGPAGPRRRRPAHRGARRAQPPRSAGPYGRPSGSSTPRAASGTPVSPGTPC